MNVTPDPLPAAVAESDGRGPWREAPLIVALESETASRRSLRGRTIATLLAILGLLLAGFGSTHVVRGIWAMVPVDGVLAVLTATAYLRFRAGRPVLGISRATFLVLVLYFFLALIQGGTIDRTAPYWLFLVPTTSFLLLGRRFAVGLCAFQASTVLLLALADRETWIETPFSPGNLAFLAAALAATGAIAWLFETFRVKSEAEFRRVNRELTSEISRRKKVESDLRVARTQFKELAYSDPVTGLANRRRVEEDLERMISRARRRGEEVALLFLDLDDFKAINDRYGHAVGDQVLARTATRLRESIRAADLAGRLGGDEFVVVLDIIDAAAARDQAERIRAEVARPMRIEDGEIELRASVGLAIFPHDADTVAGLLAVADRTMYETKRASSPADPTSF